MLRYALPEYRLPKTVLRREVELIRRLGVKFVCNTAVGTDITLNDLDNQLQRRVPLHRHLEGILGLPAGNRAEGRDPGAAVPGSGGQGRAGAARPRVAVIGGGNAAIDSARTALRMGAEVTVIYRRERKDMPAIREETEAAEAEGAKFVFLATPHRIVGDADGSVKAIEVVKTRLGEFDSSGRRRPVPTGEIRRFECDTVILAVGETVDHGFRRAPPACASRRRGTARSGPLYARNQPQQVLRRRRPDHRRFQRLQRHGLRQEGGAQHRPAADGREALGPALRRSSNTTRAPPEQPSESRRHHVRGDAPRSSASESFEEAMLGLTAEEALEEACRCLRCDVQRNDH